MATKKRVGRPTVLKDSQFVGSKLPADLVARIDRHAAKRLFTDSRSEALRDLVERGLKSVERNK